MGRAIRLLALGQKARRLRHRHTNDGRLMSERRATFYTRAWEEAAAAAGTPLTHLGSNVLRIDVAGEPLLVEDNTTSLDDPVTLTIAGDKPLVYRLLAEHDVPVPAHIVCRVDDCMTACAFVRRSCRPCVVKPARGTGAGRGVTAGVRTHVELFCALAAVASYCGDAVIEEQIEGDNYRLLYLDGHLIDAIRRRPPTVRGDGIHDLKHLIAAENAARLAGGMAASQTLVPFDRELRLTLKAGGWRLRSVPPAGQVVRLRTVINDNRREDNEPAAGQLCASVVEHGAVAARAVGARLAGVDVITPDPAVPLASCGGAVIEVNTTPGHYHHFTDPADPARAARMILERLAAGGRDEDATTT
jgi:cyanophycin synthetase